MAEYSESIQKYIDMCMAAKELHEGREFRQYDIVYQLNYGIGIVLEFGTMKYVRWYGEFSVPIEDLIGLTCLFRQSQLQEAMQNDAGGYGKLRAISEWLETNREYVAREGLTTAEHLWIAYVMDIMHDKRWKSKEWE